MSGLLNTVASVELIPRSIWIESDLFGGRHVVCQDEGFKPFTYASFHYNYAFTSNAGTWAEAVKLATALGAVEPIAERIRDNHFSGSMAKEVAPDNAISVEALMLKVNHYAALKAICSRTQSTFEMQDLENRDRMVRSDEQLAVVEADLRKALSSSLCASDKTLPVQEV